MALRPAALGLGFVLILSSILFGFWSGARRPHEPGPDTAAFEAELARLDRENRQLQARLVALDSLRAELSFLRERAYLAEERPAARPLHGYSVPNEVAFCGERLPLERPDVRARFEDEWHRFLVNRHWTIKCMRRAREAFPLVEAKLAAAGLPTDLKYVMVIESAIDPRATSSAGAVGYWQFIRDTGRRYGLRRDTHVDERRDLDRSTDAAIAYLSEMYGEFESWPLVLSGYNAGERRVRREIEAQGTRSFYDLVLPAETEAYWFRAAAVKTLFEDPERYDFVLADLITEPAICDTLRIRVGSSQLEFKELSALTGLSYRELKALNPAYRRSVLPRGEHRLVLPRHAVAPVLQAFPASTELLAEGAIPPPSPLPPSESAPGESGAAAATPGNGHQP